MSRERDDFRRSPGYNDVNFIDEFMTEFIE